MRGGDSAGSRKGHFVLLLRLLALTFGDLIALLSVLLAHAAFTAGWLIPAAGVLAMALLALSVASILVGVGYAWRFFPQHRRTILFIVGITLITLLAHAYVIGSPSKGYIGDESFYVPEGMGILTGQHCSFGAGAPTNCHLEHPPLVPEMIAAGMAVFGVNSPVGWRVMPALLGTFSIPLLFGIVWKVSGDERLAYVSSLLLALDVMFFSQSGAAFLDIPAVFFGLAAFLVYLANIRWWKFDRYFFAGVLLGLAGLSKETAVFTVMAFVTYLLLLGDGSRISRVYSALKVVLVVGLVFAAGMQVYDSALATPAVPTFVQQVQYILSYGSSLVAQRLQCQPQVGTLGAGYFCKFPGLPGGPPILPTDWLVYYSPVAYYLETVTVNPGNISFIGVAYYGITNLLETWTIYVWLPMVAYLLYTELRRKQPTLDSYQPSQASSGGASGEVRFGALTIVLFMWSYLPYLYLFAFGRVTYPFYILPALPAMSMGTAYWLTRSWFPRWLMVVYLVMALGFFFVYFPDKSFLPDWLRVVLGH